MINPAAVPTPMPMSSPLLSPAFGGGGAVVEEGSDVEAKPACDEGRVCVGVEVIVAPLVVILPGTGGKRTVDEEAEVLT